MASLDAAVEDLKRARPGWGWSLSNYVRGNATCFLHYPDGQGCVHADGETPAAAIHAVIALTDNEHMLNRDEVKRREQETKEREELARLKAKYEPDAA